ncbi:PREDICTED: putative F-box protein At3g24580 [Camelina sativa]|uniref:F-box protein At3g24580 n=1 Tax=Camelina sativa TaxID=90675 RepID=A0ABM0XJT8_CAMSA|nr:PREDICTED: putative F-box protein At3g24580 [Camelina sativa]
MRRVRSTCKKWNTLSRSRSFKKKHLGVQAKLATKEKEFMVVTMIDYKVDLMSVNFEGELLCMKRQGTLVTPDASDQIYVSQVIHCDGLLLCIMKDNPRVLAFNPYCGQPRWFPPTTDNSPYINAYSYALGYNNSSSSIAKSYRILSFAMVDYAEPKVVELKIYDFNSSSSWRVLDFTPDWFIYSYSHGVALKGNTYWFAQPRNSETPPSQGGDPCFLLCFDFTSEAFGPRLPLPFMWGAEDTVSLSNARDDQLAVLFQRVDTLQIEIWVTTKVEPNTVSWGTKLFLSADMRTLTAPIQFMFSYCGPTFFIDEDKKVAVIFDKSKDLRRRRNTPYIIGEDGSSLKEVDLGESPNKDLEPLVCPYVPSSVLLK